MLPPQGSVSLKLLKYVGIKLAVENLKPSDFNQFHELYVID